MDRLKKIIPAVCISLFLGGISTFFLLSYHQTVDTALNLSTFTSSGEAVTGASEADWEVFTMTDGEKTLLTCDEYGSYMGLTYPGQTFYYSRVLKETLTDPILYIWASNYAVCIFIDEHLLYSDYPELDFSIGSTDLPMLDTDRAQPLRISLPADYQGRTLTIAQSTFPEGDGPERTDYAFPCMVQIYSGYFYESDLISDTFELLIPAILLFILILFFLASFLSKAFKGTFDFELPILVLTVFFRLCYHLFQFEFAWKYFGYEFLSAAAVFHPLSIASLLLYLTMRIRYYRHLPILFTACYWGSIGALVLLLSNTADRYYDLLYFISYTLSPALAFGTMLLMLILVFIHWKKKVAFFRSMGKAASAMLALYLAFLLVSPLFLPGYTAFVFDRLYTDFHYLTFSFSTRLLESLFLLSSAFALLVEYIQTEVQRQTDLSVLASQKEMALEDYKNISHYNNELLMLRHDITKHYLLLRSMSETDPKGLKTYLDELLGKVQGIPPLVNTENQVLNILVNNRLHKAREQGIKPDIVSSQAPPELLLTDAELCSLVLNILDNAIENAAQVKSDSWIRLNLHCKNNHFVFVCENSMLPQNDIPEKDAKKISIPRRGYGLKIIHSILQNYGDLVSVQSDGRIYKITVAIPLQISSR